MSADDDAVDYKVSIVGLHNAGKTTLVKRLKGDEFFNTIPTKGVNMEILRIDDTEIIAFDIGGQGTHFVSIWKPFIYKSDGVVFVFDSADKEKIEQVKVWLQQSIHWTPEKAAFLFLANKQDLSEALSIEEIIKLLGLEEYMTMRPSPFAVYPCSALTGEGVDRPWEWLAEQLKNKKR